ncbi:hypothetical protein DOTSEDRAFT_36990 [Dothistroma septosporum NZE10]|uniref:Uncharacterized protein n=1 Tax=Dothistroma septosporum (strain NZE10 / CBS 128990) TaxID=675120 RepID=N1PJA8_DOTSN|nr:hypothetical protein DOTSEDRAFT_36990 [Dothistroma septosporum NZE10]
MQFVRTISSSPGLFGSDDPVIEQAIAKLSAAVLEAKPRLQVDISIMESIQEPQKNPCTCSPRWGWTTNPNLSRCPIRSLLRSCTWSGSSSLYACFVVALLKDLEEIFDARADLSVLKHLLPDGKLPLDKSKGELAVRVARSAAENHTIVLENREVERFPYIGSQRIPNKLFVAVSIPLVSPVEHSQNAGEMGSHVLMLNQVETRAVKGLVRIAGKMHMDSRTWFDRLSHPLPVSDAFLACVRIILTAHNELLRKIMESPLADTMDGHIRSNASASFASTLGTTGKTLKSFQGVANTYSWPAKCAIPELDKEEVLSPSPETTSEHRGSESASTVEADIVRIRTERDRLHLLMQYNQLYKLGWEPKPVQPVDWDQVAGRMPKLLKNDCGLYYARNKR